MIRFTFAIISFIIIQGCHSTKKSGMDANHKYTNELINESSPYLLQHAHNPVDWHPWNEETLQKAKDSDKLLIISIGYSACHWCHVMEHESFEDTLVAQIMNEHFIPIKVDREERPDVDDVYMTACHLVSGRGGWPLNAFALPDGRPIWAGTYFPKDQWIKILNQFKEIYQNDKEKLIESAVQLTKGIANADNLRIVSSDQDYPKENLDGIAKNFVKQIDLEKGGRRGSPKFPMPNNYEFLMKYQELSGDVQTWDALKVTLDELAKGGIYDQIGGGWARYSVDAEWHVPHFEKMLYDNGQLVSLFAQAYKKTKEPFYKYRIEQTLDFIKRELTSKENGFYSSLDADSEGEEGKFYVWTQAEIDSLFPVDDLIKQYYDVTNIGNWEHGVNVLRLRQLDGDFCKKNNINPDELYSKRSVWNNTLMQARDQRIRPGLDDKILTSWNALMLKGYVDAYNALGDLKYIDKAIANANFLIRNQMNDDGRLNRNYKNGKSSINGFLDDYALLIDALIALYQATFDHRWLEKARQLTDYSIEHFMKKENGMFNYTSDIDAPLVARKSEISDNVIPASNSVMAKNLKILGELLYQKGYTAKSDQMMANLNQTLLTSESPSFYSNWCQLYLLNAYPPYEIAIIGKNAEALRQEMMSHYFPNSIFLGGTEEGDLKLLEGKLNDDKTLIYVCQNKACKFPVDNVAAAIDLVK